MRMDYNKPIEQEETQMNVNIGTTTPILYTLIVTRNKQ